MAFCSFVSPSTPCPECDGIVFYKKSKQCIHCNRMAASEKNNTIAPQYKAPRIFKGEAQAMAHVNYGGGA